jgi:tRNA G10  N-methylase Trm11
MAERLGKSRFDRLLIETLEQSVSEGQPWASKFFDLWYGQHGTSYFFLFKKNLGVTNVQYAELLALLRTYSTRTERGGRSRQLQFFSREEFLVAINEIVTILVRGADDRRGRYAVIARLYETLLRRIVVLDAYFGSCVVHVPPELQVDWTAVCANSGYIHSCGYPVYVRKVHDSKQPEFFEALQQHLARFGSPRRPVFFAVYAEEDFTRHDRDQAAELRHGLDDVKFFVEKFYMADVPLVSVLARMREEFKGRLVIPDPGNYERAHKAFRRRVRVDNDRTIWLIVDARTKGGETNRGDDRYFICYDQQLINENPFHIFDENKPAWHDHTTTPHTLFGAMINITRPYWPNGRRAVLADPFAGTGTLCLEGMKFRGPAVKGGDLLRIAPLLFQDNLKFFGLESGRLQKLEQELRLVLGWVRSRTKSGRRRLERRESALIARYRRAEGFAYRMFDQSSDDGLLVSQLRGETFLTRLLCYVFARVRRRHESAILRGSEKERFAFGAECERLCAEIHRFADLRSREESGHVRSDGIAMFQGYYSKSCAPSGDRLRRQARTRRAGSIVSVCNVGDTKQASCDVLLTDPPYGFNTEENLPDLAELYAVAIPVMVRALKPGGQLVLCLIEQSRIGRTAATFTRKEIVTQQILVAAERMGWEVTTSGYSVPEPATLFRPPYYWESERALRRVIVHFRFQRSKP